MKYLLHNAFESALMAGNDKKCESIALPAISAGLFGFPLDQCITIFFETVELFANQSNERCLKEVNMVNLDQEIVDQFIV